MPVYKMPHLEGWASYGDRLFIPAIGQSELLIVDKKKWKTVGKIKVKNNYI